MSETYTVKQVAELLGFSTNSIYSFLKEGRIKGVRVGLGRFRITQDELNRVLHLSKRPLTQVAQPVAEAQPTTSPADIHFDVTSLFDWFVGSTSILIGFSLFLYNRYFSTVELSQQQWIFPTQMTLVMAGIGVILTDFFINKKVRIWHRIFLFILMLIYLLISFQKFKTADWGGGIFYSGMALALLVHIFKLIRGFETFLLMVSLNQFTTALVFFIRPSLFPDLPSYITYFLEQPLIRIIWILLTVGTIVAMWRGHLRKRSLFWIVMAAYGFIYLMFSFWFVDALAWGKAFFALTSGLTCFLIPTWESLYLFKPEKKRFILILFSSVICLMLLLIGILYVMQANIKEYARAEAASKSDYARVFVESTVENIEKTVKTIGISPAFVQAVGDKNNDEVTELLRVIFESSKEIRRFIALDTEGNLIAVYPHTILTSQNFAFRDYFSQVMTTRKTYISNTFEARLQVPVTAIVISAPILDDKNNLLGVLGGSINLDWMQKKLQEIATEKNEEYFTVFDKHFRRIISPNPDLIGKVVEKDNLVYQLSNQESIIGEGFNFAGNHMLQTAHKIPKTDWYLETQIPLTKVFKPTQSVSLGFFVAAVISVLAGGIILIICQRSKKTVFTSSIK